jgi:hypothetical protein
MQKLAAQKFVKHAGTKNQKEIILKKTHTPFGRLCRPILQSYILSHFKPSPKKRVEFIIT